MHGTVAGPIASFLNSFKLMLVGLYHLLQRIDALFVFAACHASAQGAIGLETSTKADTAQRRELNTTPSIRGSLMMALTASVDPLGPFQSQVSRASYLA